MGLWQALVARFRRPSPAGDLKRAGEPDDEPYIPLIPYPTAEVERTPPDDEEPPPR
jgi:hypothetical protein